MDDALAALLERHDLQQLSDALHGETFASLSSLERSALLSAFKARGIALSDRQKLATAIAKSLREQAAQPDAAASSASTPAAAPSRELKPQGFMIYCHRTTLDDGTSLDNKEPAPEWMIASLEKRTGRKRPSETNVSLERLNLHFMSGS